MMIEFLTLLCERAATELNCIITSLNAVPDGCRNKQNYFTSAVAKVGISISFNVLVASEDFIDRN